LFIKHKKTDPGKASYDSKNLQLVYMDFPQGKTKSKSQFGDFITNIKVEQSKDTNDMYLNKINKKKIYVVGVGDIYLHDDSTALL